MRFPTMWYLRPAKAQTSLPAHMRSFAKIKPMRNSEISLSLSDEGKSYRSRDFLRGNTTRENKILAKISEFTVSRVSAMYMFMLFTSE